MKRWHLAVLIGTRPEAIKMAPVVRAIEAEHDAHCSLVLTGQHRDLVQPILDLFGLKAVHDLQAMREQQSLAALTSRALAGLDRWLETAKPDVVLGQGDTVSVLAGSLASFFRHIPFAHVEAGLRTRNPLLPFPEEMNRRLTAQVARWHFAPTENARAALLREGHAATQIEVTGNTVIDALLDVLAMPKPADLPVDENRPYVLVTVHRRENHGEALIRIANALRQLATRYPSFDWIVPVHPNPAVRESLQRLLSGVSNVRLIAPVPYGSFCWLMKGARLILSDSGGIQEEAPALGVPVLVLREETERPEAVAIGANRLVGTQTEDIVASTHAVLEDSALYARMAAAGSPFGDGQAARRIVARLMGDLRAAARQ
jgi:UDP-N-acetylglucosamine 2-epimerase (non-hydrolysing)